MSGGRRQTDLVGLLRQLQRPLLDHAVAEHRDQQRNAWRQADDLHRADDPALVGRAHHHGGVVGETGQQARRVVQHLFDLAVRPVEERADLLRGGPIERGLGERVDERAVALLGGDPPGAGVRLLQVALGFEGRHVVADRRRRHRHLGRGGDVARPDRLGRVDVLLHDRSQY